MAAAQSDGEEIVTRTIFEVEDGPRFVVREKRSTIELREGFLRFLALFARDMMERYERKLPPPERRTRYELEALMDYQRSVYAYVSPQVVRLDAYAPGGCLREWHAAVESVRSLSLEEVEAELDRRFWESLHATNAAATAAKAP